MKRLALAPLAALTTLVFVAGCGSSGSSPAATPTTPASTPAAAPSDQPANPAAASTQIKANWAAFFKTGTPKAKAVALLEDGDKLGAALAIAAQIQQKGKTKESAKVTSIEFQSPTDAIVHYVLYGNGKPLLNDATGHSVFQQGRWKVAKATFCQLVQLGANGKKVPGCPS